jgi:hypothetical protein
MPYLQNGMEVYTEDELGMSGILDAIKTGLQWTAEGAKMHYAGGMQPGMPYPGYVPEPTFMDKYGLLLLLGGGALVVFLVMRKKS